MVVNSGSEQWNSGSVQAEGQAGTDVAAGAAVVSVPGNRGLATVYQSVEVAVGKTDSTVTSKSDLIQSSLCNGSLDKSLLIPHN
jgi:hypothetical protein